MTKVLGTVWERDKDILTFETAALVEHCATMRHRTCLRTVLSVSARVYDVLGLIAPVVIVTRMLMQKIWKRKLDWDQELPVELKREFWKWVDQLHEIARVSIPRWYASGLGTIKKEELHVFCDASEKAYGAVAYLRSVDQAGRIEVNIIACRARVAPLEPPTLPRLELLGGHLAASLATFIKKATGELETTYWTDSMVSLAWIKGDASRWKQYVANRVRDIQQETTSQEWKFVAGLENPADLCSRGVAAPT